MEVESGGLTVSVGTEGEKTARLRGVWKSKSV